MRLVSCVPSLSELIYYLNPESLKGRTQFCIHPFQIKNLPSIGGTKKLSLEKIRKVKPDLVIGTKEENEPNQFEEISREFPTLIFDIKKLDEAFSCILDLGERLKCEERSLDLVQQIQIERKNFKKQKTQTAIYLIWKNPWMTVGGDTFINSMMSEAGFINLFESHNRYPKIDLEEELRRLKPDLVLLSSEPYPFKSQNAQEISNIFPDIQVVLVDGTYFSWYGNRIKSAYSYFSKLLNSK